MQRILWYNYYDYYYDCISSTWARTDGLLKLLVTRKNFTREAILPCTYRVGWLVLAIACRLVYLWRKLPHLHPPPESLKPPMVSEAL